MRLLGGQQRGNKRQLHDHAVKTETDIVIGSRHLYKFNAKILSIAGSGMWLCSKLVSLLSGERITDTTSGFKIWSRQACEGAIQAFNDGKLTVEGISMVVRHRQCGETKSCFRQI